MQLALVLQKYESELICDFAEYYHIYDIKSITPELAAILLNGLKPESRIKSKLSKRKLSLDQMLLAMISDELRMHIWSQGGKKRGKKPNSVLDMLLNENVEPNKCRGFNTSSDFERYWHKVTGVKHG